MKDVKFPLEFDAYELCTKSLQTKLCPMREKFQAAEDAAALVKSSGASKNNNKERMKTSKEDYSSTETLKNTYPFSFPDGE